MIRTRAQLVSHRFLTGDTRFGPQVFHMGFVVDKVTIGQVLLQVILYSNVGITESNVPYPSVHPYSPRN
jgi:hypothetical protein